MNLASKIKEILADMPADWSAIIKANAATFTAAINSINTHIDEVTPVPNLILEAFRKTPVASISCVLLGQDPYPTPGNACGLAFSTAAKPPASLQNIFKCWKRIPGARLPILDGAGQPTGDISYLCGQVLLLNTSLTTVCGQADAHKTAWTPFISCILSEMARRDIPIVALGTKATQLAKSIYGDERSALIFSCGHPSPLALGAKFADVTVFNDINRWLIEHYRTPVNWGNCAAAAEPMPAAVPMAMPVVLQPPVSVISRDPAPEDHVELLEGAGGDEIVYAFTDGACGANGRKGARATYAAHIVTSISITDAVGIVAPAPNSPPTNNRGELNGILVALEILRDYVDAYPEMRIVSDSEYAINAITVWYPKWVATNKTADKCNLELIGRCHALYSAIKQEADIKFLHIRSHQPEPARNTLSWFMWNGNNCADQLCTRANARPL